MKKISILFLLIPLFTLAQFKISGTFNPKEKFSQVFLYQVTAKAPAYISYTSINKEGAMEIPLEKDFKAGMYRLVFGVPQDEYYFDFIFNGKENISFEYVLTEGATFLTSEENLLLQEYNTKADEAKALLGEVFKPNVSEKTFLNVFHAIDAVQNTYETESEGMIAHHFIKTGRIPIPKKKISLKQYISLEKDHFFNHIDFNDPVLQQSEYLINASTIYVFRFAEKENDKAYKENIDFIASKVDDNFSVKKSIMESLWNDFSQEENAEVANYIADTYLLKLAKAYNDQKLIMAINAFQKTGIGAKVPNFNLGNSQTLYDLEEANNYLLIFWSSTCSHCLKEIPEVKDFLNSHNVSTKQLQVVAFGLEDDEHPWKDTIKNYPDFIHVFGAGKWDNQTAVEYSIMATPTYFLLDNSKRILAKPETLEDLKKSIDDL
ncbi:redoxin domain-containing protein [Galbibacter sp. BG1]|uniref:TlpA family protein disulfide reductase n=1 Tax=Galbibacter sp. BG1 TaxID=1170699 RepID=UPI0015BD5F1F|nr:thioredoxin family protein [Galbibacter sp. BG1]QLE00752.1 redoxin domain-containing protein [Galbibacter sp. BG1]